MDYDKFNALTRGLRSIPEKKNPGATIGAGTDASAFHGRLGAQVALLQSPILPAVSSPYTKRRNFRGLPVDKPHTCQFVVSPSLCCRSAPLRLGVLSAFALKFTLNRSLFPCPFPVLVLKRMAVEKMLQSLADKK